MEIERHIDMTASAPVVFIDYLQLLALYEDRATDKQNTDRANYEKKVAMQAFKESGAIAYSADVLLGLQFKGANSTSTRRSGKTFGAWKWSS